MSSPKASFLSLIRSLLTAAALSASACAPISAQDRGSGAERPNAAPSADEPSASVGASASPAPMAPDARGAPPPTSPEGAKGGGSTRAVVVELFTSEGCSSCPPADELLHQMAAEARSKGEPIYFLAFHVDYWDELGWPDPFSARAFTERQRAYSRLEGATSVYTPQMIVNGRDAFVGSDARRAALGVRSALASSSAGGATISITASPKASGEALPGAGALNVAYTVVGAPPGAVLHLAIVEDGLKVRVLRGENAGKTLVHDATVRLFRSIALDRGASGAASLAWPEGVDRSRASLVAYAQESATLNVLGAAEMKL